MRVVCPDGLVSLPENRCGCPPGSYYDADAGACAKCTKGSFCVGGTDRTSVAKPCTDFSAHLTTLGARAMSARACGESAAGLRLD